VLVEKASELRVGSGQTEKLNFEGGKREKSQLEMSIDLSSSLFFVGAYLPPANPALGPPSKNSSVPLGDGSSQRGGIVELKEKRVSL